ncbi:MAG: RNA polymerase sigma factor [Clostridium sp.]
MWLFKEKSKVCLAIKGNEKAFVSLIRENKLLMYKIAYGMLGKECDIDDAIQETILKAFKNIKGLREEKNFKAWLVAILINECKKIMRKNNKIILMNESIDVGSFEDKYLNIDIINSIEKLDIESREIVILHYFEGLKQEEISEKLNLNGNTVRTKISRAKKKLYKILGEDYLYEQ